MKNEHLTEYPTKDYKTGAYMGFLIRGFFIPKIGKNKDEKKKDDNEFNIGLISQNSYRIITATFSETFQFKNNYTSETISITEYYFNNIFNVLIIREKFKIFILINLKNDTCFSSFIELKINNIEIISKFFWQNIYNKLYYIHFTENLIEFYRLNDLKKLKEPKKYNLIKVEKL